MKFTARDIWESYEQIQKSTIEFSFKKLNNFFPACKLGVFYILMQRILTNVLKQAYIVFDRLNLDKDWHKGSYKRLTH